MFAAKNLTLGQANALYKKLGGEQVVNGILDGTLKFIVEAVPQRLEYPDWVREHLTPEMEATKLRDPGEVELWLEPRQRTASLPAGHEVYEAVKDNGLIERSLSFMELKFLEANPDCIPADWRKRGLWVYAWASVVSNDVSALSVPFLDCSSSKPRVHWDGLGGEWRALAPAGLRLPAPERLRQAGN